MTCGSSAVFVPLTPHICFWALSAGLRIGNEPAQGTHFGGAYDYGQVKEVKLKHLVKSTPRLSVASAQRETTLGGGGINFRGLRGLSLVADQPLEVLRRQCCAEMKPLVLIAAQLLQ
jgi:hypothetical protein